MLITGCISKNKQNNIKESDTNMSNIKVIINDKTYTLNLENNTTVDEFINLLPEEYNMSDLNNNEKYTYLDKSLTTNEYNPKHIEQGDVMLFGNNCLVIFYKSFDTTYSYTKIGHIDNLDNLESGNIKVRIEK
jgi:hypothetical protein